MRINGRRLMMAKSPHWQLIHYNDGADGIAGGVWMDRIRGIDHVKPLDWNMYNVTAADGVMRFYKALRSYARFTSPGEQLWGRYFIIDLDIASCETPNDVNLVNMGGLEASRTFIDFGSTQDVRDAWAIKMSMQFYKKQLRHNNKLLGNYTNNEISLSYIPSLFTFPCTLRLCVLPTPDGDVIYWAHHGTYYAASRPFDGQIYGLDRSAIGPWMMNDVKIARYSQYCDFSIRSLKIYRDINFISR